MIKKNISIKLSVVILLALLFLTNKTYDVYNDVDYHDSVSSDIIQLSHDKTIQFNLES